MDHYSGTARNPLSLLREIDSVCDRFEEEWRAGHNPPIQTYIDSVAGPKRRACLIALLKVKLELVRAQRGPTDIEQYQRHFPQDADVIAELLGRADSAEQLREALGESRSGNAYRKSTLANISADPDTKASTSGVNSRYEHPSFPVNLGRFILLKPLGRGAFGTVFLARDPQLDRQIALKIPRSAVVADAHQAQRFLREARAAGQLRHPHIVPVHEAGRVDGTYFIASALVDGKTLRQALKQGHRFTSQEIAVLMSKLACALHYAHNKGIIHRDVKPGNVMLDDQGDPQIMDFGLAQRDEGEALRTLEGVLMGTPAYMSPEQADGKSHAADARSDVWSLGVMLYELLTGQRPFRGNTMETLHAVIHSEPQPLRKLNPSIPRDLETICLKALSKAPQRRYPSSRHMADDLGRWLRGEETTARPMQAHERIIRWCGRRPTVAALTAGVILSVIFGFLGIAYALGKAKTARHDAERAAQRAEDNLVLANQHAENAEQNLERANLKTLETERERQRADDKANEALAHLQLSEKEQYRYRVLLAHREWLAFNVGAAQRLLHECPPELRGWEWYYCNRLCHTELLTVRAHTGAVHAINAGPAGDRLVTGGEDKTVKIWETPSGRHLRTLTGHDSVVFTAAFSPNGDQIISGSRDRTSRLWDAVSGRAIHRLDGHLGSIARVQISEHGGVVATAGGDGTIKLWNATDGKERSTLRGHRGYVYDVAFSPGGKSLASAGSDGTVRLWDADTGKHLHTVRAHGDHVHKVAYAPDGRRFASCSSDGTIEFWDSNSFESSGRAIDDTGWLSYIAYSPDGKRVASGSRNGAVKLWDAVSGREVSALRGHIGGVRSLAYTPDGKILATAGADGTFKLWDPDATQEAVQLAPGIGSVRSIASDASGRRFVAGGARGNIRVLDAATGHELLALRDAGEISSVAFSPDGNHIATAGEGVTIWDAADGRRLRTLRGHEGAATAVAYSPAGQFLASGGADGIVNLWDVDAGEARLTLKRRGGMVGSIAFTPDGRQVITSNSNAISVWDASGGENIYVLSGHKGAVHALACSPSERILASASKDGTVRLWDLAAGETLRVLHGHQHWVFDVDFSPDGSRIATVGMDQTVRIWDAQTGRELLNLARHNNEVFSGAFSLLSAHLGIVFFDFLILSVGGRSSPGQGRTA